MKKNVSLPRCVIVAGPMNTNYSVPTTVEVEVMSVSFTTNKMRVRSVDGTLRNYDCDATPLFEQNNIVRK